MIDLDGLKLVDLSSVTLDENDKIVDGRKIMEIFAATNLGCSGHCLRRVRLSPRHPSRFGRKLRLR